MQQSVGRHVFGLTSVITYVDWGGLELPSRPVLFQNPHCKGCSHSYSVILRKPGWFWCISVLLYLHRCNTKGHMLYFEQDSISGLQGISGLVLRHIRTTTSDPLTGRVISICILALVIKKGGQRSS
jgi:hypothetical protein